MRKFFGLMALGVFAVALAGSSTVLGGHCHDYDDDDDCCKPKCCKVKHSCCKPVKHHCCAPVKHTCCAPVVKCCAPAPTCCKPAPTCCKPAPTCCAPVVHCHGSAAPAGGAKKAPAVPTEEKPPAPKK